MRSFRREKGASFKRGRGPGLRLTSALAIGFWLAGCATYSDRTEAMRGAASRGHYEEGIKEINRVLKVRKDDGEPKKWKKDTALGILERATLALALQRFEESAKDFQLADKELEFLDLSKDAVGTLGKYVYSDSAAKYQSSPVEKLSLNGLNMLNYLAQGELQGARVEAKRFTVMRNYLRDFDPEHAHGAFASYLAGFVFEKLGEYDTAVRYYDEALEGREFVTLAPALARLEGKTSYRSDRLREYMKGEMPPESAKAAELLIVVNLGRVPYKVPRRIPIGAAVGLAGAYLTGDTTLLEYGAMKFVTFPDLEPAGNMFEEAALQVDGKNINIELASDLGSEIVREYEDMKPKIIAASLTRMIARAAAAEGARAAGNQADGVVGLLAALAVEGSLVALDKPDTRSWTLMPHWVYVSRVMVPAGTHAIDVQMRGPGGRSAYHVDVEVAEGSFAVVPITTLR